VGAPRVAARERAGSIRSAPRRRDVTPSSSAAFGFLSRAPAKSEPCSIGIMIVIIMKL
jgi:hypothetical protein